MYKTSMNKRIIGVFDDKSRPSSDHIQDISLYTMITTKNGSEVIIMKKGLTELVFILDRSGSMGGLESDTIGGFNGMLKKQREQEGEVTVTTVFFDDRYEIIHDRIPIEHILPITNKEYHVRGCTALLDAVGKTIHKIVNVQKILPEEQRAEKVIFVIITDGLENASREYSYKLIKSMIEHEKEKYGWEFMFLGANIDAVAEADKMGIGEERAVTYSNDSAGVLLNYDTISETVCMMRQAPKMSDIGREWKKNIEKNRSNKEQKKTLGRKFFQLKKQGNK